MRRAGFFQDYDPELPGESPGRGRYEDDCPVRRKLDLKEQDTMAERKPTLPELLKLLAWTNAGKYVVSSRTSPAYLFNEESGEWIDISDASVSSTDYGHIIFDTPYVAIEVEPSRPVFFL